MKTDVAWTGLSNPTMGVCCLQTETEQSVLIYEPVEKEGGSQEPTQASQRNAEEMFGVLISVKSFLQFLNSHVVSTTTIACECPNFRT